MDDLVLLDTDILSELLKQHDPIVQARGENYFGRQSQVALSVLTCYQILRWLRNPLKQQQLEQFQSLIGQQIVLDVALPILDRAANLWIQARSSGHPHEDIDVIIAATAIEHNLTLVTGNTKHFGWIEGPNIENWRDPL